MSALNYSINGKPATAPDFYKVACHPQRHAVVEACAGAGKTWILVARMARALLDGASPDSILAITFTKKAASEMRSRLFELLQEWSRGSDAEIRESLALRGIDLPSQELVDKARRLFQDLLESERELQVKTFHSWFAQLVRFAPMEALRGLGLPPQYELLEDDEVLKADAWPLFLERVSIQPELVSDFYEAVAAAGRTATQTALMNALNWRSEFALAIEADALEHSIKPPLEVEPRWKAIHTAETVLDAEPQLLHVLQQVAASLGQASASGKKPTAAAIEKAIKLETALTERDFKSVWSLLRKKDDTRLVQGLKGVDPEIMEAAQDWLDSWARLKHQERCVAHQLRMSRLARLLLETYASLKHERRLIDMTDLETAAVSLLSDGPAAAWIQERLDQKLTQVLIDEFQDTNPMQWQALRAWLASYAGPGGGTDLRVFIVGDPKQSIYRFRRADPRVFRQASAFLVDGLGAQILACDHTRRCSQKVVEALNSVMPQMPARGETAADFRAHSTGSPQQGFVGKLPLASKMLEEGDSESVGVVASDNAVTEADEEQVWDQESSDQWRDTFTQPKFESEDSVALLEARRVAAWLQHELSSGHVDADEVMFLAKRRTSLAVAHRALTELGIASAYAEKSPLIDAPVVRDVLAFIEAATLQASDLSLAHALKAPWMGARDEDLIALARAKGAGQYRSWWDTLINGDLAFTVPRSRNADEWRALCARWRKACLTLSEQLSHLPVQDVLVNLCNNLNVAEAYARQAPSNAKNAVQLQVGALLEAGSNVNSGRFLTPLSWLQQLKRRAQDVAWPMPSKSVKLMTVHGAKGLEARWVVLIDAHQPPRAAETNGVLLDWPVDEPSPRRFIFVASESRVPVCARELLDTEQAAREAEDTNLLYVAMTRAEERLLLSGKVGRKKAERSWYRMLEGVAEPMLHAQGQDAPVCEPVTMDFALKVLPKLNRANMPQLNRASGVHGAKQDVESEVSARIGDAMHELLQWWRPERPWSDAMRRSLAWRWTLSERDIAQAERMATAVLTGEAAWAWDATQIEIALAETELVWQGQLLRIDRVVKHRDGAWWVLDFKSALNPQAHETYLLQVSNYVRAWSQMYENEQVFGALIGGDGRLWRVASDVMSSRTSG